MGVDIQTYRCRIGTYRHSVGVDVVMVECIVNFSQGLKTVGCVAFIGMLLIMSGIEANPGPTGNDDLGIYNLSHVIYKIVRLYQLIYNYMYA